MYETVKTVKGYGIYRMVGTKGFYFVDLKKCGEAVVKMSFKTIKAAAEFCESYNGEKVSFKTFSWR